MRGAPPGTSFINPSIINHRSTLLGGPLSVMPSDAACGSLRPHQAHGCECARMPDIYLHTHLYMYIMRPAERLAAYVHHQGFIRAETIAFNDYVKNNGYSGCKEVGALRLEGKEYVVQVGAMLPGGDRAVLACVRSSGMPHCNLQACLPSGRAHEYIRVHTST